MSTALLDTIKTEGGIKNDAALSRLLGVSPCQISDIRNGKIKVGPKLMLTIYEEVGMSIERIKQLVAA